MCHLRLSPKLQRSCKLAVVCVVVYDIDNGFIANVEIIDASSIRVQDLTTRRFEKL